MNFIELTKISENLEIVRDDLFPYLYGGNKARKIKNIEKDIFSRGKNAVVTTGGIQSNHCRATALICAKNRWKCKLILHGGKEEFENQKGNAKILQMCGADFQFAESTQIGSLMNKAMEDLTSEGYSPYYLYGGGHNKAGVEAYIDAVEKLYKLLGGKNQPHNIFLASGTGSTQAGILLGLDQVGWNSTKVHGISVARKKEIGIKAIHEATKFINPDFSKSRILFYDDYLFGGYAKYDEKLEGFIYKIAKDFGLILDTTYTGKAFYGMQSLMEENKISGKNIFWHTGGIFNLMA
ncbi:MAG: 1-aminocyclopropane-1-carboxylate deaminase/D-cysteine desulfhydrase [Cyclobacteriaceae bacterium]